MKITRLFIQALLQVVIHLAAVLARSHTHQLNKEDTTDGVWKTWSNWSSCSVECATGISVRTRQCELPQTLPVHALIDSAHKILVCDGDSKQIKICNTHECPANHENRRDSKCFKFNARVFNGKKYAWESYINPRKRCELTCKAKGHHFYARLSNRAVDGTVCSTTSLAVCIKGKCKDVGCDGIVDSNVTRDQCGVCMGDGSTCRTITGLFTRPELSPGYTKIITIPAGSTNINITELRHSKNYLAFRTNHDTILNGDNKVFPSGSYKMLGSTLVYKRRTRMCRTQCAYLNGPTNSSTDLMIFGFSRNSGIMYSFNVPTNVTDRYFKDLIARDEQTTDHQQDNDLSHETAYDSRSHSRTTLITSHRARPASVVKPTSKPATHTSENISNTGANLQTKSDTVVHRDVYSQQRHSASNENGQSEVDAHGESQGYSIVLKANTGPDGEIKPILSSQSLELDSTESESNKLDSSESQSNNLDSLSSESNEWNSTSSESNKLDSSESQSNNLDSSSSESNEWNSTSSESNEWNSTESDSSEASSVSVERNETQNVDLLEHYPTLEPITNTDTPANLHIVDDSSIEENGDDFDDFIAVSLDDTQRREEEESNLMEQDAGNTTDNSPSDLEKPLLNNFQQDSNINDKGPLPVRIPGNNKRPQSVIIPDVNINDKRPQRVTIPHRNINRKRPHSVRIPMYSQRFTFRDRYRALINAKIKQNRNLLRRFQHKTNVPSSGAAGGFNNGRVISLGGNSGTGKIMHTKRPHRQRNFNDMRNLAMDSINSESQSVVLNAHVSDANNRTWEPQPVTELNPVTQAPLVISSTESQALDDNNQGDIVLQTRQKDANLATLDSVQRRPIIHRQPVLSPPNSRVAEHDQTLALEEVPIGSDSRVLTRNIPLSSSTNGNMYDKNLIDQSNDRVIIPRQPVIYPNRNTITSNIQNGPHGSREDTPGLHSELSSRVPLHYSNERRTAELTVGRSHTRVDVEGDESLTNSIRSTYSWRVSGFSECTTTCGGGVQQTTVVCMDTRSQAVVTDENCVYLRRPIPQAVTCSTRPCPAKWTVSGWSSCSATCGEGVETRTVVCRSRVSRTLNITMSDESCSGEEKPESTRACQTDACYTWNVGNFSVCDVNCGDGVRQRTVTCVNHDNEEVNDEHCTPSKPSTQEICDMGSCGHGWYHTMWPEECPADCGAGVQKRRIHCAGEEGQALPLSRCEKQDKPETERTCRVDTPCGGTWFTGEWNRCNSTCGSAFKTRNVVCVKQLPGSILAVVDEENCKGTEKPESGRLCQLPPCQPEWYITSWKKCSKSCGTGFRTREVKCLDHDQHPSAACVPADKPRTRETCNTRKCRLQSTATPTSQARSAKCKDSFSQCVLVKKARLCRFKYYAKMCCHSCSGET